MHTLNSAASIIAVAFNRMLAEGEDNQTDSKWLTNDDERSAHAWLIEGVKNVQISYDDLYDALTKEGVESDEAERLIEGYFWHLPVEE